MLSENNKILFHCSSAYSLMSDKKGAKVTDKQKETLKELKEKKEKKGLTETQQTKLDSLIQKINSPFELSNTAKTMVEDLWRDENYSFCIPVLTNELRKGIVCEQEAIQLINKVVEEDEFRVKNSLRLNNEFLTGECDIELKDVIEDVKVSYTLKTYMNAELSNIYFAQGQSYMHLYERPHFRLHYCMIDTPKEIVEREQRKLLSAYGYDEDSEDYQKDSEMLWASHMPKIPIECRVKSFSFDYDAEYMKEMEYRAKEAQKYYESLSLPVNPFWNKK